MVWVVVLARASLNSELLGGMAGLRIAVSSHNWAEKVSRIVGWFCFRRACNLVVLVIDARTPIEDMKMLIEETHKSGIRFNQEKPLIEIRRTHNGGISVPLNNSSDSIPYDFIKQVLNDMKYINAEVIIHERGLTPESFVDACYGNLEYKKAVICLNKIDLFSVDELKKKIDVLKKEYSKFPLFGVSAESNINLDKFKNFIWEQLGFMWVYLKEQRKEPDMDKPLVVKRGDNVEKVCQKIHKDFLNKFKYAKIKGKSVKFDWQRVGLDHKVEDGDIVEIYAR